MIISKDNKNSNIAIKLAALSLAGESLSEIPYTDEEMEAVFEYAKTASIGAITYMAIENALTEDQAFDEDSFYFKWKSLRLNAYRRNMLFDKETKKILNFFNQNDIWYMPLKGSVIKNLYPTPDVREMNDVDILIDDTKREATKEFMLSNGYKPWEHKDKDDDENSDDYIKDPFLYYEIHRCLFEKTYSPEIAKHYENAKDMLVKDEGNNCGYHFTAEEFYIYLLVHAYKHFIRNGVGVRFLMDVYVYLNSHQELDLEYIDNTCEKLGIKTFENDVRKVAKLMFDLNTEVAEDSLTKTEKSVYESIIGAGVFGNIETRWKNQVYDLDPTGEISKAKYIKSRLFPDDKWYRIYHPFVYKHKIVKPFFIIYRGTVMLFRGRKTVKKEMDQVGGKDA